MAPTVYLISGANRGIGLALVRQLLERPETVIFAGAREPSTALDLLALQADDPERLHIVKLVSGSERDAAVAVRRVGEVVGRLDVVVANAGMNTSYASTADIGLDVMREHFEVNVLGPLALFQASYPALKLSSQPKFVLIGTNAGSLSRGPRMPLPVTAYGSTKAAAHWLACKLWYEYPELVVAVVHPGYVRTDMMEDGIKAIPQLERVKFVSVEESARGVLEQVDGAKREEEGPKLVCWNGEVLPW